MKADEEMKKGCRKAFKVIDNGIGIDKRGRPMSPLNKDGTHGQ
jgi:DNA mismatch repair ATPase MutL